MELNKYFVRFNEPGNLSALLEYLKDHEKVVIVREYKDYEKMDGEHFHMCIEKSIKDQMFRKIFNKFGFKGNKSFTLKDWIENLNGEAYICKGEKHVPDGPGPDIVFNNMWTDDEVLSYHNQFWAHNNSLRSSNSLDDSSQSSKKRKVVTFQQHVVTTGRNLSMTDNNYLNKKRIAEYVVDKYGSEQDRGFKRRQMRECYEQLLYIHHIDMGSGQTMRDQMVQNLMSSADDMRM